MENVAANQTEAAFQIERRMNLPPQHRRRKARRVSIDGGNDMIGGLVAFPILLTIAAPAPSRTEVVAEVLAKQARHMLPLGRKRRISVDGMSISMIGCFDQPSFEASSQARCM